MPGCLGLSLGLRQAPRHSGKTPYWQQAALALASGFGVRLFDPTLMPVKWPVAGAGFDAGAAAEEAKRRAGQAKAAAAGWLGRARGVLSAVGREVTEVLLPKTGARRFQRNWALPGILASFHRWPRPCLDAQSALPKYCPVMVSATSMLLIDHFVGGGDP